MFPRARVAGTSFAVIFCVALWSACGGGGSSTPPPVVPPPPTITLPAPPASVNDFRQGFIYQIVTDRFFNGDTANDNPPQSAGLFDATGSDWHKYWGGDLAGIQQKLDYLKGMGVSAIWISPPVDNINVGVPDSGFHGFWARDMKRIEEHFGDTANSWTAFDALVAAAHARNMAVIVDFAANHGNPRNAGEFGKLYDNGTLFADYANDDPVAPRYHHTANITDWNDPYQLQFGTLADLADLDQENPAVDKYLKDSLAQFMAHGADGFRFDAVKHVNWGWEYSMTSSVLNAPTTAPHPPFMFGEWFQYSGDARYGDSVKFANNSGMSLLDFPLAGMARDVFSFQNGNNFQSLDTLLTSENSDFAAPGDLVTFVDNHDLPRLLSISSANSTLLNQAMVFLMTCRGVPVIYYGDEQKLHNDTNGGGDPYNRNWMSSFDTTTSGYKLLGALANLRANNTAVTYGSMRQRWVNPDVYIYEREFNGSVALVAINRGSSDVNITGLLTNLPAGSYKDFLSGYLGGVGITITGTGTDDPVTAFTLPKQSVSIWQAAQVGAAATIGAVTPRTGNPGTSVRITGSGFGAAGSVKLTNATSTLGLVTSKWTDSEIDLTLPTPHVAISGEMDLQVILASGSASQTVKFTLLTAPLVPVHIEVDGVPALSAGDQVQLTGDAQVLGEFATGSAYGPVMCPAFPRCFTTVSLPGGSTVDFKFLKLAASGAVTEEGGANHSYTVPSSGVGSVTVSWQN